MKIAVLGGSFNPIHIGHLALADDVCVSLGYDKVFFVPAFNPPHKEMNEASPPAVRAKMVELACSNDERFMLEMCEIERKGTSYTFDTICFLEKKLHPDGKIGLIMGEDTASFFHLWFKADEISKKCNLIIARRPLMKKIKGFENTMCGKYADESFENGSDNERFTRGAIFLQNEMLPISSTEIRSRISRNESFKYLVPMSVFEYITNENLYDKSDH